MSYFTTFLTPDRVAETALLYANVYGRAEAYQELFTFDEAVAEVQAGIGSGEDDPYQWLVTIDKVTNKVVGFAGGMPLESFLKKKLASVDIPTRLAAQQVQELVPVADGPAFYVSEVGVCPDMAQRGLGTDLLAHLLTCRSGDGYSQIVLRTGLAEANAGVVTWYRERFGFQPMVGGNGEQIVMPVMERRMSGEVETDQRGFFRMTGWAESEFAAAWAEKDAAVYSANTGRV